MKSQEEPASVLVSPERNSGKARKLYIESYGCQMNFSDSEIVASILSQEGFELMSKFASLTAGLLARKGVADGDIILIGHQLLRVTTTAP